MVTLNGQAREDAWKALFIITLISALLVNLALLYRIVRAAGGLLAVVACPRGVRLQTLVSLVIGDMFVALFSLVVMARETFEKKSDPELTRCLTVILCILCPLSIAQDLLF